MTRPLGEYYRDILPLDIQDIQRRVTDLKHGLDFFESIIDMRSRDEVVKLTYENLYFSEISRQNQQIDAIWSLLNIGPLELEQYQYYLRPEASKLNSAATYELLPNAREIQASCGNDVTGWLFE